MPTYDDVPDGDVVKKRERGGLVCFIVICMSSRLRVEVHCMYD